MSYDGDLKSWELIHEDRNYSSYCVLELYGNIVVMGNLEGKIKIFSIGKVFNFYRKQPVINKERTQ